jgi:hypothetical protein
MAADRHLQMSKQKGFESVFPELKPILEHALNATGLFLYNPLGHTEDLTPWPGSARLGGTHGGVGSRQGDVRVRLQSGILRSNCIDCLDRTNVVQCIFGLLVLGVQLRELDLSDNDYVDHDSSMAMELMNMYATVVHLDQAQAAVVAQI